MFRPMANDRKIQLRFANFYLLDFAREPCSRRFVLTALLVENSYHEYTDTKINTRKPGGIVKHRRNKLKIKVAAQWTSYVEAFLFHL